MTEQAENLPDGQITIRCTRGSSVTVTVGPSGSVLLTTTVDQDAA